MKLTFFVIKTLLVICSFFAMYFSSYFWIGSKDEWISQINNNYWSFLLLRFFLTIFSGLIFFLISLFVNYLFKNTNIIDNNLIKRFTKLELIYMILASVILVLMAISR